MADDNANLVSQIEISGADKATDDLNKMGDAGEKAFNQIADAADKANKSTSKAGDNISGALGGINDAAPDPSIVQRIQAIGTAAQGLGGVLKSAVTSVSEFGIAIVGIGAAGVGAIAGIAKTAAAMTEAARGVTDNTADITKQQIALNRQQAQGVAASANYRVSVNKLDRELAAGKITVGQYNDQLTDLKQSFEDQAAVQAEVAAAQEELLKKNQKLQQQAQQQEAYNALARTYGVTLTNSLIALGAEAEQVQSQLRDAFGPALARVVDSVLSVIQNNSQAITAFIDQAASAVQNFITANGPLLSEFMGTVGQAARGIGQVVVSVIVPAFKSLMTTLDGVASALNTMFGSNINGMFLLLSVTLLKVTGGFTALLSVLRASIAIIQVAIPIVRLLIASFTPWGAAIAVVVAALTLLATTINWSELAQSAMNALRSIVTTLMSLPSTISDLFSSVFAAISALASSAVTRILAAWQGFLLFFTVTLPQTITTALSDLWSGVGVGVQLAVQMITTAWQAFIDFVVSLPQRILSLFTTGFNGVVAVIQAAITTIQGYFTNFLTFIATLPDQIVTIFTNITTTIGNLFQTAFDRVSQIVSTFVQKALSFLQPVIDLLNRISNAASDVTGDSVPAYKTGGHIGSGYVRGRGTSTSDSIFAWLSNNEFVMQARAVRKYGLGFMHAVNSGTFDLRKLMASMAGYATGGLISAGPAPAFASSGAGSPMSGAGSSGGRTLNLTIDGQTFEGLTVPESVADRLTKFAVHKQSKRLGRRPSWVGGN